VLKEKTRRQKLNEYINNRNNIKTVTKDPVKAYSNVKKRNAQTELTEEKRNRNQYTAVDYSQIFSSGKSDKKTTIGSALGRKIFVDGIGIVDTP
jgi:hypothetical protein